jgi:hypothetical protein
VSVADGSKSGTAIANVLVHHANQDFQNPPIKLGTSGGNATDQNTVTDPTTGKREIFCCSGTLGSLASRGGDLFILSNNHVLDKSGQGAPGDPISQPGLADTNCGRNPNTIVANLTQAAPLSTASGNVDAGIAKIIAGTVDTSGAILDLNGAGQPAPPSATLATAAVNLAVAKSGDATGLTCSTVFAMNLNVLVKYALTCNGTTNTFFVTFTNQIAINGANFSNSGDSGSLIVTSDTARPVALLYAGSTTNTLANPIQQVLTALKDPNTNEVPNMVGGPDHAVGCPASPQAEAVARDKALTITRLPDTEVARASAVKDRRGAELMRDAAITGVGVGQSEDNPNESAIVVFAKAQPRVPIPAQIDGVRTKVIFGSEFRAQQAAVQKLASVPRISEAEIARVKTTKEKHAQEMMSDAAILGVGVGASSDNPDEAALIVFVDKDKAASVPPEIDGARTRVIATDPFRTFNWGKRTVPACSRK